MIIRFPGHKRVHHVNCVADSCAICDGGLFLCERCGCAEGAITTDCPGEPLPFGALIDIYDGRLDYNRRRGWVCMEVTDVSP